MYSGALTLQSCAKQVERIHSTGAKRSTKSANTGCGEVTKGDIILVIVFKARFAPGNELLEVLESSEIDGAVRKHANKAHRKTAVEGANAAGSPHLASSGKDQGIAVKATFDSLVLNTAGLESVRVLIPGYECDSGLQFQCIEGIDAESGSR